MFFRWLKQRRRRARLAQEFPAAWQTALERHVPLYARLTAAEQEKVRRYLQVFIPEKNWEGCNGFVMNEEAQATIAGHAGILTLGLGDEYFEHVLSILVYPESYVARERRSAGGVLLEGTSAREGEAWYRGPVILSWSDIVADTEMPQQGRNLVLHEFAHQLDMLNGSVADGVPPLDSQSQFTHWNAVLNAEFQQLRHDYEHGLRPLLDSYAATNKAEFFAVVTEMFFLRPSDLQERHPELYENFCGYYRREMRE